MISLRFFSILNSMDSENQKAQQSPLPVTIGRLFEYENYRTFLHDFFNEQKKLKKMFSHRYFARRAGFSSSSAVLKVIKGQTNLSRESIKKIIKGIGMDSLSALYFENLVNYNQVKNSEERKQYRETLESLRKRTTYYHINKNQLAYFENWYYPVIRELAHYGKWDNDYEKLASLVIPPITAQQAQEAVEVLIKNGLLRRNESGNMVQTDTALTSVDIPPVYKKKQRREILQKGIEAAESLSAEQRHIAYTTLAVSEKTFHKITEYIDSVRMNILDMAVKDPGADKVYQLIFELFPFSKNLRRGEQ